MRSGSAPRVRGAVSPLVAGERIVSTEDVHEVPDLLLAGERIREWQVGLDGVVVASSAARAQDVPCGGELGDDSMRGAFRDPNGRPDLA